MASIGKITVNVETLLDGKQVDIDEIRRAVGRSGPCEVCRDIEDFIICQYADGSQLDIKYCPMCGRRLIGGGE